MKKLQIAMGLMIALLLVMGCHMAFAQGIVTGSITGTVVDTTGAIIANAKVTATHIETNSAFIGNSNEAGLFLLTKLPPGKYNVTVEAGNFRTVKVSGTEVNVARETNLSKVVMEIGGKSEIVEVTGAAPLIETQSTQISMTFEAKKVTDLPIGRGIDQLALFLPGVSTAGSVGRGNNNGSLFSSNGQRPRSNNFQIDGQGMNDASVTGPAIFLANNDIVAEYQVMTNYDASYGRNTGSQVNVITKSGSNSFHGTAFETWRGSKFDSLTHEEHRAGETEPSRYVRNTFGGTVGGPIAKDKAWFFGSALWDRIRTAGGTTSDSQGRLTPTPNGIQQLQAAFPSSPGVAFLASSFGPANTAGNPAFGSLTTRSVSNGVVTVPVEFGTPTRNVGGVNNTQQYTGRADWQMTSKDRIFGRYIMDDEVSTNLDYGDGPWGFFMDVPSRGQQVGVDWTHQFSNRFVNQARFNWTRLKLVFEGGTTGCFTTGPDQCPISIAFTDSTVLPMGLQGSMPQGRTNQNYEWQDNANFTAGRHNFKFGGYWSRQSPQSLFLPNYNGSYTFANFNAFITNTPNRLAAADGTYDITYKENDLAFYFQDDFRVSQSLTLTMGLRWEWYQNTVNHLHDISVARQTGSDPFWNTSLPLSRTTVPKIDEDKNNFGPVLGFAWNVNSKTLLRGGFRVAYDPSFYNIHLNVASGAPVLNAATLATANGDVVPLMPTSDFNGAAARAVFLPAIPTGGDPALKGTLSMVSPTFHNPYSQQWNLGVQRELSTKAVVEVRYLGSHTVGLFQNINGNPGLNYYIANGFASVIPAGLTPCADTTQPGYGTGSLRGHPDCARRNVNLRTNKGGANYNALQTRFDTRSLHGLTSTLSYTWSHNLDNASDIYSTTGAGMLNVPQNPFDNGYGEYGNSNFDYRHTVGLQVVYETPWFKNQQSLVGKLLGGWQSTVTYRFSTGQPWTPIQSKSTGSGFCDTTNLFSSATDACRPILNNASAPFNSVGRITAISATGVPTVVNQANTTQTVNIGDVHWLVNNDFAARYFGSPFLGVHRNTLNGQTTHATNLSMAKNIKLTERFNFEFRATAFNVLNHNFLGVPGNNVSSAATSFGNYNFANSGGGNPNTLESGLQRRRLEFGGKLRF